MNRLARASSPYLQQHADNPVDWYPWGEEALLRARAEGKPILLSIGYSACHWCHVMAHESFENPETARVMNERYVNIKVDREERPDLDRIYQNAHMLLTRRNGGWPLTVILTPDQVPFFAGTYFPVQARHGLPAFIDVLNRVAEFLEENPEDIAAQNASLQEAMARMYAPQGGSIPGPEVLDRARGDLNRNFDARHGGFGGAPKFPHPATLEWLAWHGDRHGDARAEEMLGQTLEAMARGGIFDQVGGGFCRYSTDDRWMIPHFEKMLYDNGPLLGLYARQATRGDRRSRRVVRQTVGWLTREMTDASGAFYSSLDADSEGEEGRFYVWTPEQVQAVLEPAEWEVASRVWGLDGPANFEGRWHLYEALEPAAPGESLGLGVEAVEALLQSARGKLLALREQRVRPHRDEKILTSWNALMISGLIRAGEALDQPEWLDRAEAAMRAVRRSLWRDGRLYASFREGADTPMPRAYLDDHASLLAASLDLLRVRWSAEWLDWAQTLAEVLLRDFADAGDGGFFYTRFRGRGRRRLLLHRRRSRGLDPETQGLRRRRNGVGQRRRRAGPVAIGVSAGRTQVHPGRRVHPGQRRADGGGGAAGSHESAAGPGPVSGAAADGDPARSRGGRTRLAARGAGTRCAGLGVRAAVGREGPASGPGGQMRSSDPL